MAKSKGRRKKQSADEHVKVEAREPETPVTPEAPQTPPEKEPVANKHITINDQADAGLNVPVEPPPPPEVNEVEEPFAPAATPLSEEEQAQLAEVVRLQREKARVLIENKAGRLGVPVANMLDGGPLTPEAAGFSEGQRVRHSKFGEGVVRRRRGGKVKVAIDGKPNGLYLDAKDLEPVE